MRQTSHDRAWVGLHISGYQFPDHDAQGEYDWDANWLQISGTVVLADGKTWSFENSAAGCTG